MLSKQNNKSINLSCRIDKKTYDELVASGNLGIVSNTDLRKQLQTTRSEINRANSDILRLDPISTTLAMKLQPFINWKTTGKGSDLLNANRNISLDANCDIDLKSLVDDPKSISILTQLYRSHFIVGAGRRQQLNALKNVIKTFTDASR